MERAQPQPLVQASHELVWLFLAAAAAAAVGLVAGGASRAVPFAFGPALLLAGVVRYRGGSWRQAAGVFLAGLVLLVLVNLLTHLGEDLGLSSPATGLAG